MNAPTNLVRRAWSRGALTGSAVLAVSAALAVVLVGVSPSASAGPRVPIAADTPSMRVAIVGDSYTNGTAIGGRGANSWPAKTWQQLGRQGLRVAHDVAAEGRAGYGVRGDQGNLFIDLTAKAVRPDDTLVVFYGSRNDQDVDVGMLTAQAQNCFALARHTAPSARLLVIGPPWPTADVPPAVLQIRDVLAVQAVLAGATFVDPLAQRWFVDRPDLIGRDGVHPTDAGHVYQADRITPLIREQLPTPV